MNAALGFFSYWEAGCPQSSDRVSAAVNSAMASSPDSSQELPTARLLEDVIPFCRLRPSTGPSRGTKGMIEYLNSMSSNSYTNNNRSSLNDLSNVAMQVEADRIAMPENAATCDPLKELREPRRSIFKNLLAHATPGNDPLPGLPEPCLKVAPGAFPGLVRKLLKAGKVLLVPESEIPCPTDGQLIVAGLFSAMYKELYDRLIVGRRPQNSVVLQLGWAKDFVAFGPQLTQLIVHHDESVIGSGNDLFNYSFSKTFRYLDPPERFWTSFGRRRLGRSRLRSRDQLPCLLRYSMYGDTNAVDIAHETHMDVLRSVGCMPPHEHLCGSETVPASHLWEGLYIDGHFAVLLYLALQAPHRNMKQPIEH